MQVLHFCLLVALPLLAAGGALPAPYTEHCKVGERNVYPPPQANPVPWFTIDLDQAPDQRWNAVSQAYKQHIRELVDVVKNLTLPFFQSRLIDWVDRHLGSWNDKLPQPYADEIKGIARETGMPLAEIVLYNVFYEIFTVCTSIVAEDPSGKLYHARNLDFGLFLGWDPLKHDWILTNKLKTMVVNLEWKKGGKTLYKSVNFAGFIGIYNGVKQNAFTVTANERFALNGGYLGIIEWLLGLNNDKWMTFLTRDVMETATNFAEATRMLATERLMSPVYFIVGGKNPGEGAIITRDRNATLNTLRLDTTKPDGWYILETNYDNWEKPLFLDDRRTPGKECMNRLGRGNVGFEGIYTVLSSTTNLNKLTVYTVIMQVDEGKLETHIQECPQPCWPF